MLQLVNATKDFGGLRAVNRLSLEIKPSTVVGLIGPNGAGKTTVQNLISGLYPLTEGEIHWQGENITGLSPDRIAHMGIIRSFQVPQICPGLTVLENVMIGCHRFGNSGLAHSLLTLGPIRGEEADFHQQAASCLARVKLNHRMHNSVESLSFGERRLVDLARCMAARPKLLLLDEPAAGLSLPERQGLGEIIQNLAASGTSVLLVEHNLPLVLGISHWVYVLEYGSKIAEGSPQEIKDNPRVIQAYLGKEVV